MYIYIFLLLSPPSSVTHSSLKQNRYCLLMISERQIFMYIKRDERNGRMWELRLEYNEDFEKIK
jgi:hypothetical protein